MNFDRPRKKIFRISKPPELIDEESEKNFDIVPHEFMEFKESHNELPMTKPETLINIKKKLLKQAKEKKSKIIIKNINKSGKEVYDIVDLSMFPDFNISDMDTIQIAEMPSKWV